ncbi:MAG TPA: selenocysteine-specific translation elongation factor [Rudaea sp.]
MIVGTAGHIDHGKTTLVRALTGVDTDRLKEEKERGISIELGYAYTPLANGEVLGFVDVPGHERLIHTMVAGASGIDFVLLVIAADDGPMPQTREHLAILDLLGTTRGAVALTKIDRVDPMRRDAVARDIAELLAPTALHDAPLFAVNATDSNDAGVRALAEHLHRAAAQQPPRDATALFRLAVDRVFSLPGHGTIATGSVHAGSVRVGDTLHIMPAGRAVRVRAIHAQQRASEQGRAGERCAINLAGVDRHDLARGDWLADPRAFAATMRVDVALRSIAGTPPLRDGARVHFHLGTCERIAHVVRLDETDTNDARTPRAQLVFTAPLCATPGDRFIIRDAQAAHTIGGGIVLDPYAPARRRRSAERRRFLDAIEDLLSGGGIANLIAQCPSGLHSSALARLTGRDPAQLAWPEGTLAIRAADDVFLLSSEHAAVWRERSIAALRDFHTAHPDDAGIETARLRRIVAPAMADAIWRGLIETWQRDGAIARSGPWLHDPEHSTALTPEEEARARVLQPLIAAGRFDPPWVRDLARSTGDSDDNVRRTLRKLAALGVVFPIVPDLYYDRERVRELAAIAATLAHAHGAVEAAAFRDALALGRKRAIQILEFFDRVGYTRRVRDAHRLRGESHGGNPF